MAMKTTEDWHGCPIRYGAAIFGDAWVLLILRDLMFKGARHFADFLQAGEGISTNILATRLARLEAEGIISRRPDPEHGARVIYRLTEKGQGLVPVILEIIAWSERWDGRTEVPRDFARRLHADRDRLAADTILALDEQAGNRPA